MSESTIKVEEIDGNIVDQDGNKYALVKLDDWEHMHHIIQELNEALVEILSELDEWVDISTIRTLKDPQSNYRLDKAEKALAIVPEPDRKGGTWRFEE